MFNPVKRIFKRNSGERVPDQLEPAAGK